MVLKAIRRVRARSSTTRSRYIGLRVSEHHADLLTSLAVAEGVGLSTYARMILEAYVVAHGGAAKTGRG